MSYTEREKKHAWKKIDKIIKHVGGLRVCRVNIGGYY